MDLKCVTFLLCSLLVSCTQVESMCRSFDTITNNLREVVIGKCEVFQQSISQDFFCNEGGFRNCTAIWDAFSVGFPNMSRCDVPAGTYDEYIRLTEHSLPRDMSQFWENVYPFVNRYSNNGHKRYTVSDTLTGYIGDGLNWCTDPSTPGRMAPPGTQCPGWEATPDCPQSAVHRFWSAVSRWYAEKSSGQVNIMLNASSVPIYANTTYLAVFELPYLRSGAVTQATVLLINEWPSEDTTKCDDPSLQILANQMEAKNISYYCVENRRDVADLLCLQDPYLGLCKPPLIKTSSASVSSFHWSLLLLVPMFSMFELFLR